MNPPPPAFITTLNAATKSPASRSAGPIRGDLPIAKPASGAIHDVIVVPLKRIPDERGTIMHMLRCDDPHFRGFGEIYFSTIYPGIVKGWHRHRDKTLNYACVSGRIKLAVFDDRTDSPTRGVLMERFLGPDDYSLVQIPPGLWNGFKGMAEPHSIVANCCTHAHDAHANGGERLDPFENHIPYDWRARCH